MNPHDILPPAQYNLSEGLAKLLQRIDDQRELKDEHRTQQAPLHVSTGKPLAENRLEYGRGLIIDAAQWVMDQLEFNKAAFGAIPDARISELTASVGRIRALLHPAQGRRVCRDGEIPQERHLDDEPPSIDSSPQRQETRTPRLDELRHEAHSALHERVKAGMPLEEIRQDAEVCEKAEKLKRAQKSSQRHLSNHKSDPWGCEPRAEAHRKIVNHAHGEMERRLREFTNAESHIRRFLRDLNAGTWSELPDEEFAVWKPSTWYEQVTDGALTSERLRRAKSDGRIHGAKKRTERAVHFRVDEIVDCWPEFASMIRSALAREKCEQA